MLLNTILLFQSTDIEREEVSQSLFDVISQSGTMGIIIYAVLLVLSFIAFYIFFERYLTIKRASKVDESFMNNIRANVQSGNIAAAKALCQTTDSPVARMVEKVCKELETTSRYRCSH
ncbi:MAG: hypothetical protein R2784_02920 [Saprospiraceae bacterium]